jgi:hypothetical protein
VRGERAGCFGRKTSPQPGGVTGRVTKGKPLRLSDNALTFSASDTLLLAPAPNRTNGTAQGHSLRFLTSYSRYQPSLRGSALPPRFMKNKNEGHSILSLARWNTLNRFAPRGWSRAISLREKTPTPYLTLYGKQKVSETVSLSGDIKRPFSNTFRSGRQSLEGNHYHSSPPNVAKR